MMIIISRMKSPRFLAVRNEKFIVCNPSLEQGFVFIGVSLKVYVQLLYHIIQNLVIYIIRFYKPDCPEIFQSFLAFGFK